MHANETLRQIAEDAFLLAHNVLDGGDLQEDHPEARDHRICELIIDIGERIARTAGITDATLWKPESIAQMIDAN